MTTRHFRQIFIFFGLLSTCCLLWYWMVGEDNELRHRGRGVITREYKPTILFTGNWWQKTFPYLKEANEACPRCHFTQDSKHWDTLDTVAIVFHGRMLTSNVPPRGSKLWVFMMFEAINLRDDPSKWENIPRYDGLFNWTLSYRRDSDIWVPYGKFIPKTGNQSKSRPSFNERWAYIDGALGDATYKNVIWEETPSVKDFGKKRTAAWIVSRCESPNGREDIVSQLQRHGIAVDIYGPCGNLSCSVPKSKAITGVDCRVQIRSQYKFYLAFENSNCVDYVTEKYFEAVGVTEMVAVVYGGADYIATFPPKSFINVKDFPSVKELAEYLKELSRSPEKWLEYFSWRKDYWVQTNRFVTAWCDLCQKVLDHASNDAGENSKKQMKVYDRIWEWWLHAGDDKNGQNYACY